jgi:RND family efflux transporter MFP subunit
MILALGCGKEEPGPEPIVRPVRTVQVFAGDAARVRSFSGLSRAGLESNLSFKVAGTVERLPVKVGDRVRSGQLLAALDDTDYELRVRQTAASLERAQAELRNAESSYERVRALYENNNASRAQLDQALTARESARAEVRSTENSLELARLQLEYAVLKAPVAGAIRSLSIERNENVLAGQTVVVLSAGERPEVEVGVPEMLVNQVREGMGVRVRFDALGGRSVTATVTEVGVAPERGGSTFPVIARIDDVDPEVRPGMAAEVEFELDSGGRDRMTVPSFAVSEDRTGRFVYVVELGDEGRGTVRRRAVEVGDITSGGLEILSGLDDGDLVVTAGVSKIQDGLEVRVELD